MKFFKGILPHISIALSLALGVLVILNEFNPRLGIFQGPQITVLVLICCIISIVCAAFLYADRCRDKKSE